MSMSSAILRLRKDWDLISCGNSISNFPELKRQMENAGWHKVPTKKAYTLSSHYAFFSVLVLDSSEYRKQESHQGSRKWYEDLCGFVMPDHKPGFLTKTIG